MLVYVPQRRSAAASRTWLLLIFLLPWPGLVAYLLFGRIYLPKNRLERQERASRFIREAQSQMGVRTLATPMLPPNLEPIVNLASRLGDFEPFGGNKIELLTEYAPGIQRLIDDIDQARNHVHLLYYIYGNDEWGQLVAKALARAVKRGVKCRVLLDAVGSKHAITHLAPRMRLEGIEVQAMLPFHLFRRNSARFDLRNHRKIAVIDGRIGYTGSQNIVLPNFVKGFPNEELMARIIGPVVIQLQAVFLADQYFETGTRLEHPDIFPDHSPAEGAIAQVVPSGPGYKHENGQELMIAMLYAARQRVVITTPYFVPDEPFLQAIRSTVLRGVDVHLVLSKHANQLITQLAQRSYYDELLEAGVKIHLYKPRFLHAKHFTIDDEIVLIGSTNIDIRSFALNAEVNILFYGAEIVNEIRAIQEGYIANSEPVNLEQWRERPLIIRTIQSIARLADSFL
ncbi:cardiolipin synthase [Pedosphaera parvula]|uniref:Cardiolipin synthase n=1 Tax=Pedosphaera parvula (strain Ellin514) TaxID=320771 RepID=B9XNB6_PEDPL|nr:cardiolipin synthase [Pedosphaera parvula]EEF58669.1 phospholipase D/Transphosphatidylase [Pedosphaera parvula Ellin514]